MDIISYPIGLFTNAALHIQLSALLHPCTQLKPVDLAVVPARAAVLGVRTKPTSKGARAAPEDVSLVPTAPTALAKLW